MFEKPYKGFLGQIFRVSLVRAAVFAVGQDFRIVFSDETVECGFIALFYFSDEKKISIHGSLLCD